MSAPIHTRLRAYFRAVFRRGCRAYSIDFDALARRLDVSRRTVERGVATLKNAPEFVFKTLRVGRSFAVQVSDRHPSIKGVFLPKGEKKETQRPAGISAYRPAFKPRTKAIAALAACVTRGDLADQHWDNCKVRFRFPHAFLFAFRALCDGHAVPAIVRAYDAALHQRHKDATDAGACADSGHWEPSSTVTLAAQLLNRDGKTASERWAEFFGNGAAAPAGWQPHNWATA